jgi:hypothetical protein
MKKTNRHPFSLRGGYHEGQPVLALQSVADELENLCDEMDPGNAQNEFLDLAFEIRSWLRDERRREK